MSHLNAPLVTVSPRERPKHTCVTRVIHHLSPLELQDHRIDRATVVLYEGRLPDVGSLAPADVGAWLKQLPRGLDDGPDEGFEWPLN